MASAKASNVEPLETVAGQIVARIGKGRDMLLAAKLMLDDAKVRIDNGEAGAMTWPGWCNASGLSKALETAAPVPALADVLAPLEGAAARLDAAVAELHAALRDYLAACARKNAEVRNRDRHGRGSSRHEGAADRATGVLLHDSLLARLVGTSPTSKQPTLQSHHVAFGE